MIWQQVATKKMFFSRDELFSCRKKVAIIHNDSFDENLKRHTVLSIGFDYHTAGIDPVAVVSGPNYQQKVVDLSCPRGAYIAPLISVRV